LELDYSKDPSPRQIGCGLVLPCLICIIIGANLALNKVVIPPTRGSFEFYRISENPYVIGGFVTGKAACAIGLFAFFWMANRETLGRYWQPVLLGAGVIAVLGFIIPIVLFFLD